MLVRIKTFSRKKKNKVDDDVKDSAYKLAGAAGIAGSGALLYNQAGKYLENSLKKDKATKNSVDVINNLLKNTEGTKVIRDKTDISGTGSCYYGDSLKDWDKWKNSFTKKLKSRGLPDEKIKEELSKNVLATYGGTDTVKLGSGTFNRANARDAAVFAHELGHSKYGGYADLKKADKGGKLGRLAHKLSRNTPDFLRKKRVSLVAGIASGYRGAKQKDEKGKESTLNKVAPYSISALNAPILAREASASAKALKLLKKHGADKTTMSKARKTLAAAGLTYTLPLAYSIAGVTAGRQIGKLAYKFDKKKDSDKKK